MRQMLLLSLFILIPSLLFGQSAPTRAGDVAAIVQAHAGTLGGDPSTVDDRKRELLHIIVRSLNVQDGGNWGELLKTDQGGYVPADIIVWRPTLEHFDVLTDTGPMWGPHGPVRNPAWLWVAAPGGSGPPTGGTPPPVASQPPPVITSVDYDRIRGEVQAARSELAEQAERIYADLVNRHLALARQLEEHNEKPGMMSQTFGNRYVQMLLVGTGVFLEEWMRRRGDSPTP